MKPDLCPKCSIFRRRHPELVSDSIEMPQVVKGARSGQWFIIGCRHARHAAPYESEETAIQEWNAKADELFFDISEEKAGDIADWKERQRQVEEKIKALTEHYQTSS